MTEKKRLWPSPKNQRSLGQTDFSSKRPHVDQKSTLAPSLCCHDSELITFASPTTGCHSRGLIFIKSAVETSKEEEAIEEQRREPCTPSMVVRLCISPCPGRLHPGGFPVLGDILIHVGDTASLSFYEMLVLVKKKKVLSVIFAICRCVGWSAHSNPHSSSRSETALCPKNCPHQTRRQLFRGFRVDQISFWVVFKCFYS